MGATAGSRGGTRGAEPTKTGDYNKGTLPFSSLRIAKKNQTFTLVRVDDKRVNVFCIL